MKNKKITLILAALFFSAKASAALVTYNFSGEISLVDINYSAVPSEISTSQGSTFYGTYTFDTDFYTQSRELPGNFAEYEYSGNDAVLSINVNGVDLVTDTIRSRNNYFTNEHVVTGSSTFGDSSSAFPELTGPLPPANPDLDNHTYTRGLTLWLDSSTDDFMPIGINGFTSGNFNYTATTKSSGCIDYDYDAQQCISFAEDFQEVYRISGSINSFTLAPVPVPAAVWLFISGIVGLAGFAKYRKV